MQKDNKLIIPVMDNAELVAEINDWNDELPKEICIYLRKDETIWQDIAIVRQGLVDNDIVQLLVYADKDNEDFTHTFEIGLFEEKED